jgi:hypothetical protein
MKSHYKQQAERAQISASGQGVVKWFTAMCFEGKPVTGPMIIEKAYAFYDQIKITDKFMFSWEVTQHT